MKKFLSLLIISALIGCAGAAFAAETEKEYTAKDKFSRGLYNMVTCPFEWPITIYNVTVEENPVAGVLYGVPLGFARTIFRFVVGAVEASTFPFEPYGPILKPEYLFISE